MKTIDRNDLVRVSGGVVDQGDGQGCTGGCIPSPLPRPRPPVIDPTSDGGIGGIGGWRPSWPNVMR